jgi:hypothetical protein
LLALIKSVFHFNCKHACFSTQNNHVIRKIIISIHVSFSHLYRKALPKSHLKDPPQNWVKPIDRPKSKFKANPHYNTFEMGILPTQRPFVLKGRTFVICITNVCTTRNDRSNARPRGSNIRPWQKLHFEHKSTLSYY